ncbi:hypothetical protein [Paraburkholderia sp. J69-2]|uniref:hypothetical protein n=1 Tax=Paraburkholderia sp. J69-2 TaxID=2805437 RepID=UPI002AB272AC|nr:hypothetical protein [Paraburkholderia sp. J69-2]
MKRNPKLPVFPPTPIYKPVIGLLATLIALAACVAAIVGLGTALLRVLEVHAIADRLLPTWPWWKLTVVAVVGGFTVTRVCEYAHKWAND